MPDQDSFTEKVVKNVEEARKVWRAGYEAGVGDSIRKVETLNVYHGDHLAGYAAPSTDADEIVKGLKRLLVEE